MRMMCGSVCSVCISFWILGRLELMHLVFPVTILKVGVGSGVLCGVGMLLWACINYCGEENTYYDVSMVCVGGCWCVLFSIIVWCLFVSCWFFIVCVFCWCRYVGVICLGALFVSVDVANVPHPMPQRGGLHGIAPEVHIHLQETSGLRPIQRKH